MIEERQVKKTIYPKEVKKVSNTPALSTVTEESSTRNVSSQDSSSQPPVPNRKRMDTIKGRFPYCYNLEDNFLDEFFSFPILAVKNGAPVVLGWTSDGDFIQSALALADHLLSFNITENMEENAEIPVGVIKPYESRARSIVNGPVQAVGKRNSVQENVEGTM